MHTFTVKLVQYYLFSNFSANMGYKMANALKCIYLTISNKHHPINYNYYLSDHLIKRVSCTKYLGVTFDEHLTWKNHIHSICAKANATQVFIRRNVNHCPRHIKPNCYNLFVRPIIEYESQICAPYLQVDISAI